tara:strand:+ start:10002 stop:10394 length:393 start_codon:yes stop_codon:yes gene_type:complete
LISIDKPIVEKDQITDTLKLSLFLRFAWLALPCVSDKYFSLYTKELLSLLIGECAFFYQLDNTQLIPIPLNNTLSEFILRVLYKASVYSNGCSLLNTDNVVQNPQGYSLRANFKGAFSALLELERELARF